MLPCKIIGVKKTFRASECFMSFKQKFRMLMNVCLGWRKFWGGRMKKKNVCEVGKNDDSCRSWFDKNNVFLFYLHLTKMSQIYPNLSCKRRTILELNQDMTSFWNKICVSAYWYLEKAIDLASTRAKFDLLETLIVAIVLLCYHWGFGLLVMVVFKHWKISLW